MASGESPSGRETRCRPDSSARSSRGSSSQEEDNFGFKNKGFSSCETLKMMEIIDNNKKPSSALPDDNNGDVSLVGVHPYHTLEPEYDNDLPSYYDPRVTHTMPAHLQPSLMDNPEELLEAVDAFLKTENLSPESGNHSNRSSVSLSDSEPPQEETHDIDEIDMREPLGLQDPSYPSLPVIPEANTHSLHSSCGKYPSNTMFSTNSGYLRADGSTTSCRSPIYETVSSADLEQETMFGRGIARSVMRTANDNSSNSGSVTGCTSCAQLRRIGQNGSSTYGGVQYRRNESYGLPGNDSNSTFSSMDNPRLRLPEGYLIGSGTAVPMLLCNDKGPNTNSTQLMYHHVHTSKDDLKDRPTWRCLAVGFVVLAFLLFAIIAFLTVLIMTRVPVVPEPAVTDNPGPRNFPTKSKSFPTDFRPTRRPPKLSTTSPGPILATFIGIGSNTNQTVPPHRFWFLHLNFYQSAIIELNLTIPRHSSFVMYGKRAGLPSHSQYDFTQLHSKKSFDRDRRAVDGTELKIHKVANLSDYKVAVKEDDKGIASVSEESLSSRRVRRSTNVHRIWSVTEEFSAGEWFLGIYNDGEQEELVQLSSSTADGWSCPSDCSGNGGCVKGQCICNEQYTGIDCSRAVCPVLCNDRGRYLHGRCECFAGWKGQECHIAWDECLVPDCSGHGMCAQGECLCDSGYQGEACDEEIVIETTHCSNHSDCGEHAQCLVGVCHCLQGWTGPSCSEQTCLSSCSPHGECIDSKCVCDEGWNGKYCRLDGCPQGCSGHGVCQFVNQNWQCSCSSGYHGDACQVAVERRCDDGSDNDGDSLTDCGDPDCCSHTVCSSSDLCVFQPDAKTVLPPMLPSAPFFERYRAWIDRQLQIDVQSFNPSKQSRASVIRGRVSSRDGSPIPQVKVRATNQPASGYTYSKKDGWFDLIVVGGGAIQLGFTRHPLVIPALHLMVPINEIVVTQDVVINNGQGSSGNAETCLYESKQTPDFNLLPQLFDIQSSLSEAGVSLDQLGIQESIQLPESSVSLNYYSHRFTESVITISLENNPGLHRINLIHVTYDIGGRRWVEVHEPEPSLTIGFTWDRINAYGQIVYGKANAKVSVGYEYYSCSKVAWSTKSITINGADWSTTDMGGWFFPMHHTYNPATGVLLMGDGSRVDYSSKVPSIRTIMGMGRRRVTGSDHRIDGKAKNTRLLAPTAIVTSFDGSIYIGDADMIIKIRPNGNVTSIINLSTPGYKYYLAVDPSTGTLYLSEPQLRKIVKINEAYNSSRSSYATTIAGNGRSCSLVQEDGCGDGGPAIQAKLRSPKGIAIDEDGNIFFIDHMGIRYITPDGIIRSFLATPGVVSTFWRPNCGAKVPVSKLSLQYPSELAINPMDGSLYVVEEMEGTIIKITREGMATVIAGVPSGCSFAMNNLNDQLEAHSKRAEMEKLVSPIAIAFSSSGELYVAETDIELMVHRVRKVTPDGYITPVIGDGNSCDCRLEDCECFVGEESPSHEAKLYSPISLAVQYDGSLLILDQGNLRVRQLYREWPLLHRRREVFEITSPNNEEMLLFDSSGFHFKTKNILLEESVYVFNYTDTHDRLTAIQDSWGFAISITRNGTKEPIMIQIGKNGTVMDLQMGNGYLRQLQDASNLDTVSLKYDGNGRLVEKSYSGHLSRAYKYSKNGHLEHGEWSTGEVSNLSTQVNKSVAMTMYQAPGMSDVVCVIADREDHMEETLTQDDLSERATLHYNGTSQLIYADGTTVSLQSKASPLLDRVSGSVYSSRRIRVPGGTTHSAEWVYSVRLGGRSKDGILIVDRNLKVNGQIAFRLNYNRFAKIESLYNANGEALLVLSHSPAKTKKWHPEVGDWVAIETSYDRQGRLTHWQRGYLSESYGYDELGYLTLIKLGRSNYTFEYRDASKLERVILPGDIHYNLLVSDDGNFAGVVMPNGTHHQVNSLPTLDFTRNSFAMDNEDPWLIQNINFAGQNLMTFYPGTGRRISKQYDKIGRMMTMIFDKTRVNLKYYRSVGHLKIVEIIEGDFSNELRMKNSGLLLRQQTVSSKGFGGFLNAKFEYGHGNNLQVTSISGTFNWTILSSHEFEYDPIKGHITRSSGFSVTYPEFSTHVMSDSFFSRQYRLGDHMLLQSVQYEMGSRDLLSLSFFYTATFRVGYMIIGSRNSYLSFGYDHDERGQLIQVSLNDSSNAALYRYAYSDNGNVIAVMDVRKNKTYELTYDYRDCVTRVGEEDYQFDMDGFLSQRGEERFDYNSRGLLVHAYQSSKYDVRYKYDGLGRRIWRKDHTNRQVQYFYAHPTSKWRITHIYDKHLRELWVMDYNLEGSLIGIRRNRQQWYVLTDHLGSILQVHKQDGTVLKEIIYDPWGNIKEDLAPTQNVHLGYRGGLQDPLTRLVHLEGRDYDPVSMRWTSPDPEFYNQVGQVAKLHQFNLYTFQGNSPITRDLKFDYFMDLPTWLKSFGYNMEALLPSLDKYGRLLNQHQDLSREDITWWQKPVGSVISNVQRNIDSFDENLHVFPNKHLSSHPATPQEILFQTLPSLVGNHIKMSLSKGRFVSHVINNLVEEKHRQIATVFNGSLVGERWQHCSQAKGKVARYFFKTELRKADLDLALLGLSWNDSHVEMLHKLSSNINITVQRISGPVNHIKLNITDLYSSWTLFYGLSGEQVTSIILKKAKQLAVEEAWRKEKWLIANGRRASRHWTVIERQTLLRDGFIPNYVGNYTLDLTLYPEAAFDGNNIRLERIVPGMEGS